MIGTEKNERRDWTLLIFIIPLGIILILLVGELAVRLVPFWRVEADMNSNLEPDVSSARPFALLEPILPQILTPMAWAESYLTPGAAVNFPPFLTFEPSVTPSLSATVATASPVPTSTTITSPTTSPTNTSTTPSVTPSKETSSPTNETPSATATTATPSATATTATPSATPTTATPTDTPIVSTLNPVDQVTPAPTQIGVGTPPNNTGPGANDIGNIADGSYVVISLSVTVNATPDNYYDLAFYEYNYNNLGFISLDNIIIGISHFSDGSQYYEVFNWGNGTPDANSNVGEIAQTTGESDNQNINTSDLYDPDGAGPAQQTGILIDVDTATSNPPADTYEFIVLISPSGGSGESAQVDAVQAVEVPIPTPTP